MIKEYKDIITQMQRDLYSKKEKEVTITKQKSKSPSK